MSDYWLGFFTLPTIALAAIVVIAFGVTLTKKNAGRDKCDACELAGIKQFTFDVWAHNHWYVWATDAYHVLVSKTAKHRKAWMETELKWVKMRSYSGEGTIEQRERVNRSIRRFGVPDRG